MAKVKFSEEDFRKDPNQTSPVKPQVSHFKKNRKYYIGAGVSLAIGAAALAFWPKGQKENPIIDNPDTLANVVIDVKKGGVADSVSNVVDLATENVDVAHDKSSQIQQTKKPVDVIDTVPSGTVEEEALSVIRGNYGNNPERRRLLKERYQEIQNKVNEMYRNGLVH